MKKIIFTAALLLSVTQLLSQVIFSAYKIDIGKKVNNEWVFDGATPVSYTITVSKDKVYVNDKTKTSMTVFPEMVDNESKDQTSHIWNGHAIGDFISLTEHKDIPLVTMAFVYGDKCYVYYIKSTKSQK